MEYGIQVKIVFFSLLVFLLYFFVFGILHGKMGMLIWTFIGVIFFVFIKFAKII